MSEYFDSSALVKLLIAEPGSAIAVDQWEAANSPTCVTIGLAEVAAALAAAERGGRINVRRRNDARRELDNMWSHISRPIADDELAKAAANLAVVHGLRGYDAVHLAAAVATSDLFVSADQTLLSAARAEGLGTTDVSTDS